MNKNLIPILITLLIFCFSFKVHSQDFMVNVKDSLLLYNRVLSIKEMHEDLEVLLNIHESANSGLYAYRTKQQIDSIYSWAFESIKDPMRITDFFKIMLHLADFEGSVHNYTEPDLELMNFLNRQKSFFPFPLMYIEGQIIFDGRSAPIPPGSRIISINGIKDTQLMQSFYKYYPSDGYSITRKISASVDKSFGINYLLEYGLSDEYLVEYRLPKTTSIKKVILSAVILDQREKNIKNRYSAPITSLIDFKTQPPYSFRMVKSSVGLLNLRWFGMVTGEDDPAFPSYVQFLDNVFVKLKENNVSNLIIDIRNNPGGSDPTFEQPVMYLTDQNFKENLKAEIVFDPYCIPFEKYFWGVSTAQPMDSISIKIGKEFLKNRFPLYRNGISLQNSKYNPTYYPKSPQFDGNLYLLINENVASAASHFASLVKGYVKNVTIIGVETSGGYYAHNGHSPLVYKLPNSGIKTQFSIVNLEQDAPKKEDQPKARGIIPDFEVWPSLNDFLLQKDTQMEFTFKLIEK